MAGITLDDLLELGQRTVVKKFYRPIDKTVDGFDENWLRKIALEDADWKDKVQAIKSHEYIKPGKIITAELEKLGLQLLFYADNNENPLTDFSELIFYAENPTTHRRLDQLELGFMRDLEQTLKYRRFDIGYMRGDIDPIVAEIEQIGNFNVDSFGPNKLNS